ncbi:phospholipase DDHD2-like isoform X1 [Stegodyphus dumicola]|uniref:phospholipase DDHD2-like isoform X1 n=1 Tax=Stegodyphus dumicola TaxID=202533 RepID=UPI0015B1A23E|nr:phospholipase DDHD2-like isoform X1 [Stegodyphus dumicola]
MDNKVRNNVDGESSLLLQMPKSMFSVHDFSSNTFLMPVAIDKSDTQNSSSTPNTELGKSSMSSGVAASASSICQLEQPLLMRKTSPEPPQSYSASHVQPTGSNFSPSVQPNISTNGPFKRPVSSHAGNVIQTTVPQASSKCQNLCAANTYQINTTVSTSVNSSMSAVESPTVPTSDLSAVLPASCEISNPNMAPPGYYSGPISGNSSSSMYHSDIQMHQAQTTVNAFPYTSNDMQSDDRQGILNMAYYPVKPAWLFCDTVESKEIWYGFSELDSEALEEAFQKDPQAIVATDGGRYDAYLEQRIKKSVYYDSKELHIRRCTWFYKSDSSQKFVPYEEHTASLLEQHYYECITTGKWQRRINISGLGSVVLENPQLMLHYKNELDVWPSLPESRVHPKVVKRGMPEGYEIMPNESSQIDHLVFIVQGIGSFCDLRFRTVAQCVDGFRDIANRLIMSHFKHEVDRGRVGRVEFLPLAWHAKLHTSEVGLDRKMRKITLLSIPKLRHFTNDTLLDILLYSSPSYCQQIINTVASELNKLHEIFLSRNHDFCGKVFVAGHSLGSLILFDILANQNICDAISQSLNDEMDEKNKNLESISSEPPKLETASNDDGSITSVGSILESLNLDDFKEVFARERIDLATLPLLANDDLKNLGIPTGPRTKLLNYIHTRMNHECQSPLEKKDTSSDVNGKSENKLEESDQDFGKRAYEYPSQTPNSCMSAIKYPRLHFEPACFFALGSPISMFLAVRGFDTISEDFRFPTCPSFFHIFHPYDPVAFRIEPLIDPNFSAKPVLIPHHKGRKRMHLEIRENLAKVGIEIKEKVMETLRYTWNSLSGFAKAHTFPSEVVEAEVDKLVKQQISESENERHGASEASEDDIQIGCLNGGRRIDYVLQEKPIEALNDYIFALTSHATYWDSEDTVLMILREIYAMQGISAASESESKQAGYNSTTLNRIAPLGSVASNQYAFTSMAHDSVGQSFDTVPSNYANQNLTSPFPVTSNVLADDVNAKVLPQIPNIPPNVLVSQPLGPPPLSGFVKKSPFAR